MNILYKASATSTGGRDGRAVSSDNALDVKLAAPRELGGNGAAGTNPGSRPGRESCIGPRDRANGRHALFITDP